MVQHADIRKEVQGRFCVGCAWATITNMRGTQKSFRSSRRKLAWMYKGILGFASSLEGLTHKLHSRFIMKTDDLWSWPKDEPCVRITTKWQCRAWKECWREEGRSGKLGKDTKGLVLYLGSNISEYTLARTSTVFFFQ